jgi:hypothetical protein
MFYHGENEAKLINYFYEEEFLARPSWVAILV